MNDFSAIFNTISKYEIKNPTTILPIDKVPLVMNVHGYYVQKSRIIINRILPFIQEVLNLIPRISEGPQQNIIPYFIRASCFQSPLIHAVSQLNNGLPEHLRCTKKVALSFSYLAQFEFYITELSSPKASSFASYIPSFKEALEKSISALKDVLDLFSEIEEYILPECIMKNGVRIDYNRRPLAQTVASLLYIADELSADIRIMLQNHKFKASEHDDLNEIKELQIVLNILSQFSNDVFANIGAIEEEATLRILGGAQTPEEAQPEYDYENASGLNTIMGNILSRERSMISMLNNIDSYLKSVPSTASFQGGPDEKLEFTKLVSDLTIFMRFVGLIDAIAPNLYCTSILQYLTETYRTQQPEYATPLNEQSQALFGLINFRIRAMANQLNAVKTVKLTSYSSQFNSFSTILAEEGTIRDMLTYSGMRIDTICKTAAMVVKFYAASICCDNTVGEKIFLELGKTSNTILDLLLKSVQAIATKVQKAYKENYSEFNPKQIGELNYYTFNLRESCSLSAMDADNYCKSLKILISCFGALPKALRKIASSIAKNETKKILSDLAIECDSIMDEVSFWSNLLILSFSNVVILHSELSESVITLCELCKLPNSSLSLTLVNILKNIPDVLSRLLPNLRTGITDSTKFLTFDTGNINTLLRSIRTIEEPFSSFNQFLTSSETGRSEVDTLLYILSCALEIAGRPLPSYVNNLSVFVEFEDIDSFVAYVSSQSYTSKLTLSRSSSLRSQHPLSLSGNYNHPFSQMYSTLSAIQANQQFASSLVSLNQTVAPRVNSIWALVTAISAGKRPAKDAALIMNYEKELDQVLSQTSTAFDAISTPDLPFVLHGTAKQIMDFEAKLAKMTGPFKDIAEYIVNSFRNVDKPEISTYLENLLRYLTELGAFDGKIKKDSAYQYISAFSKKLTEEAGKLLSGSTTDLIELGDAAMALSSAVGAILHNLGEPYASLIRKLQQQLIDALKAYILSDGKDFEALKRLVSVNESLTSLIGMMNMNELDLKDLFIVQMNNLMRGLNCIRTNGENTSSDDLLEALASLEQSLTAASVFKLAPEDFHAALFPIRDMIVHGKYDTTLLNKGIKRLAEEMAKYRNFWYENIAKISSTEDALDLIYSRIQTFRKASNKLLRRVKASQASAKGNLSNDGDLSVSTISSLTRNQQLIELTELANSLTTIATSVDEGYGITIRSLELASLKGQPITGHNIQSFGQMSSGLASLIPAVLNINETITDDQIMEIRRFLRKMTKQFDNYINIIESPTKFNNIDYMTKIQRQEIGKNKKDFEALKAALISSIADVSNEVASINWAATNSFTQEVYEPLYAKFNTHISDLQKTLLQNAQAVLQKAIGDSATAFNKSLETFQLEISQLIEIASNVDFTKHFASEKIADQSKKTGLLLSEMTNLALSLVDHIIIKPDPEAASRLPDDYSIPTNKQFSDSVGMMSKPEKQQALESAMASLKLAHDGLSSALADFIKIVSDPNATSDTLLSGLDVLKTALDKFVDEAMKLTLLVSSDPRLQLQLQNSLHEMASSFTAVKEAMRSRLMRAENFQQEMDDAIAAFQAALGLVMQNSTNVNTVFTDSSKETSTTSEAKDAVSRELEATAQAIEEMTIRLKEMENQPMFSAESTSVAQNAQEGSLSAFVIQNANPILAAAALILKRAQQITQDMLKKFGKIENEQLLIRSAKELSDAAALLIFAAEIVLNGFDEESVFKVIAAAKIVKASVCALVAQVLVKGGDPEQIMDRHVRTVIKHTDNIIKRGEEIVLSFNIEEEKKVKKAPNLLAQKLNLTARVSATRKKLQEAEQVLYKFRKRF